MLKAILDNAVIGIILTDKEMKIVEASKSVCLMLGYDDCAEIIGQQLQTIFLPKEADEEGGVTNYRRYLGRRSEETARRKDGTETKVELFMNAGEKGFVFFIGPAAAAAVAGPVKTRIMIVEKNVAACERLNELLDKAGYEVWTASDVASALNVIQDMPPDIMLLDMKHLEEIGVPVTADIARVESTAAQEAAETAERLRLKAAHAAERVKAAVLAGSVEAAATAAAEAAEAAAETAEAALLAATKAKRAADAAASAAAAAARSAVNASVAAEAAATALVASSAAAVIAKLAAEAATAAAQALIIAASITKKE